MEFVQIVGAHDFTCGITLEQTVYCWGGDSHASGWIPGLYEQISAASSGNVACGVLTDGKINCWGKNTAIILQVVPLRVMLRIAM
jgi:hypothetical protein